MKRIIIIFAALFCVLSVSTCKKYDDGPSFTLLTKRARITGDWKLDQFTYDNKDLTKFIRDSILGANYVWTMRKDGTYQETGKFNDAGVWKLIENKERLHFSSTDPAVGDYSYRILRLTKKELWLESMDPNTFRMQVFKLKQ